jgi:hypothetical protein
MIAPNAFGLYTSLTILLLSYTFMKPNYWQFWTLALVPAWPLGIATGIFGLIYIFNLAASLKNHCTHRNEGSKVECNFQ